MKRSSFSLSFLVGVGLLATLLGPSASARKAPAVVDVRPGYRHTCARTDDDSLYCWGSNATGMLGMGDTVNRAVPEIVPTGEKLGVTIASAGFDHQCAGFEDGSLKCWGANTQGKLGLGTTAASVGRAEDETVEALDEVDLGGRNGIKALSLGVSHTCAVIKNGTVKCWGANESGQLGLGDARARGRATADMGAALPAIDLGKNAVAEDVCTGLRHSCARLADGRVKCWGLAAAVGLGKKANIGNKAGDMGDALSAVALGQNTKTRQLGCGADFSCALLDTGNVKCWGRNTSGRLGLGLTDGNAVVGDDLAKMGDALPSVKLGTGLLATGLACGRDHCCALLENGALKCWGGNAFGQLGAGDRTSRGTSPDHMGDELPFVSLGKLANVKEFWVGHYHNCARLSDGRLKCWGRNREKQIGPMTDPDVGVTPEQMGEALPALEFPQLLNRRSQ